MLTVWAISIGGKYSDYYVQRLQREVKKYLNLPHRFICIADHHIDRVITIPPINDLQGWWQKVNLFKPGLSTDINLYIDLDTVITNDLTEMVERYSDCTLAAANNWAQSGHNSVQSSVMIWKQNKHTIPIWREFQHEWAAWPPRNDGSVPFWGDQEWITALESAGKISVTRIYPPWIRSYKYHVRGQNQNGQTVPHDCRCVIFHGKPDPGDAEVTEKEKWFAW